MELLVNCRICLCFSWGSGVNLRGQKKRKSVEASEIVSYLYLYSCFLLGIRRQFVGPEKRRKLCLIVNTRFVFVMLFLSWGSWVNLRGLVKGGNFA